MALPSTGSLSFNQIRTELGLSQSNSSLRNMSSCAGKSAPDAVSEFRGYSSGYPFVVKASMCGYGSMSTEGYQDNTMKWSLVAEHSGYGSFIDTDNNVSLAVGQSVQIDAYASGNYNYNTLDIYTACNLLYATSNTNYGTISTTQYKTFSSSEVDINNSLNTNAISVNASSYYRYGYY